MQVFSAEVGVTLYSLSERGAGGCCALLATVCWAGVVVGGMWRCLVGGARTLRVGWLTGAAYVVALLLSAAAGPHMFAV